MLPSTVARMPRPAAQRLRPLAAAAVCLFWALGCTGGDDDGDGDGSDSTTSTTATASAPTPDLPPTEFEALEEIFQPRYEPLGMRVTRASMVELEEGPHLQLYVEPIGGFTTQQYLDAIVPTTAAVVPFIFDEWANLASFDVCQEPPPGVDDSVAPEQVTVVALTREQAASLDWPTPGLADLMGAVAGATFGEVRGNDEVEALPDFQTAREAAG